MSTNVTWFHDVMNIHIMNKIMSMILLYEEKKINKRVPLALTYHPSLEEIAGIVRHHCSLNHPLQRSGDLKALRIHWSELRYLDLHRRSATVNQVFHWKTFADSKFISLTTIQVGKKIKDRKKRVFGSASYKHYTRKA